MEANMTEPEAQVTGNQFCVRWADHHGTLISVLENLFNDEMYVDCTLATDGQEISAHKVVLSACSPYLNRLLKKHYDKHPIIVLKDVEFFELQCMIEYMYKGEVHIRHDRLSLFLKAAETLQIAGLSGVYEKIKTEPEPEPEPEQEPEPEVPSYQKDVEGVVEYQFNVEEDGECISPEPKRQKTEVEEVEYLTQEEGEEIGEIKIKSEMGTYQVYVVDDETGALKEMEVANEIPSEKIEAEVIDGILQEETEDSVQEIVEPEPNKQIQVKIPIPEKVTAAAYTQTKIKPRAFIHRDDYNFSCTKCGGLYKHESSFLNHLRHDCNQVHTCESCRKRFKNKRHLLDHVRDDCGRVHVCPRCSKYFKQKVNLTTHMKHYCKPEKVHNVQTYVTTQESM